MPIRLDEEIKEVYVHGTPGMTEEEMKEMSDYFTMLYRRAAAIEERKRLEALFDAWNRWEEEAKKHRSSSAGSGKKKGILGLPRPLGVTPIKDAMKKGK